MVKKIVSLKGNSERRGDETRRKINRWYKYGQIILYVCSELSQ
jgi:hypothetical protein